MLWNKQDQNIRNKVENRCAKICVCRVDASAGARNQFVPDVLVRCAWDVISNENRYIEENIGPNQNMTSPEYQAASAVWTEDSKPF